MKTAHIITHRNWQRDELAAADGWQVEHSFGFDVPHNSESVNAWWLPQAQAVQLMNALSHHRLTPIKITAPSPNLLETLPMKFLGRKTETLTVNEAVSTLIPWPELWWKMSTAKHDKFPAQPRSHDQFLEDIKNAELPQNSILQWSEELPPILSEHRFFIRKERRGFIIAAHSGYLKQGTTVYDGATFTEEETQQAYDLVEELLEEDLQLPPSFVVDVAVTSTDAYVLEFNPSWCSGWYNADVTEVLKTVERGFSPTAAELKKWKYLPDPALIEIYTHPSRPLWSIATQTG